MLSASSAEIRDFLEAYTENQNLAMHIQPGDSIRGMKAIASDRSKYIAIDEIDKGATPPYVHRGGRFLIDRSDGTVYSIKGYGKRGYRLGSVAELAADYRVGSATWDPSIRGHIQYGHAKVNRQSPRPERPTLTVVQGGLARLIQRNRRWRYARR